MNFRGKYAFLSNFFEVPSPGVYFEGFYYPTVEHAYQAAKSLSYRDRLYIYKLGSPVEAKKYGKNISLRSDWELVKIPTMIQLVYFKFKDPWLKDKLVDTYPENIVEENDWGDTFWGTCKGQGKNILGNILSNVRQTFIILENEENTP